MRNSAKPTQPGSAPSSRSYLINLVYFLEENRRGEIKQNERKKLVNNHDNSKKSTHRHEGTTGQHDMGFTLPHCTSPDCPEATMECGARGGGPGPLALARQPSEFLGGSPRKNGLQYTHEHTHGLFKRFTREGCLNALMVGTLSLSTSRSVR